MAEDHKQPEDPERYARESFSFRRMKGWQLWGISLAAIVIVLILLAYAIP
jgi:hypothetical protein